jgi:phage RecT family recombinase
MSKADGDRKTSAIALVDNNINEVKQLAGRQLEQIRSMMQCDEQAAQRYIRIAVQHYIHAPVLRQGETPAMHRVDPRAYLAAVVDAATDKLMPDGRDGWIIPYDTTCRWHPSWRGLVKLARRVTTMRDLSTEAVYATDKFKVKLGGERQIDHEPYYSLGIPDDKRGSMIGVYAGARIAADDFRNFEFRFVDRMRLDKIASMSGNPRNKEPSNVWVEHFEAMARKHAMRQFLDWIGAPDDVIDVLDREDRREESAREALIRDLRTNDDAPSNGASNRRKPAVTGASDMPELPPPPSDPTDSGAP